MTRIAYVALVAAMLAAYGIGCFAGGYFVGYNHGFYDEITPIGIDGVRLNPAPPQWR